MHFIRSEVRYSQIIVPDVRLMQYILPSKQPMKTSFSETAGQQAISIASGSTSFDISLPDFALSDANMCEKLPVATIASPELIRIN